MKSKYKIGDLVKIKSFNFFRNHPDYNEKSKSVNKDSCFIMEIMKDFCKKKYKIDDIIDIKVRFIYKLRCYHSNTLIACNFDEWMFDNMIKEKIKLL